MTRHIVFEIIAYLTKRYEFLAVNPKIYFLLNAEQTDSDGLEAMLVRKHEWESTTKKASNR